MAKLIIVESPSKADTIQKYLKELGYKVIASKGHIRDLPIKELGIDIKNNFEIHDVTMEGKEKVIKEIKEAAKDADEIFLASDPDREGEKISQSISEILPKKNKDNKKIVYHRITFNSVTKESILKALQSPGEINEKKCEAQKTRRILDRLVGYKISPILQNKMGPGLSAGRVQSVALRMIVEREDEIKNFIPKSWFSIKAKFNKDKVDFISEYFGKQTKQKEVLNSEEEAKKILEAIDEKDFVVNSTITEDKKQNPTAPFTTSKLQQEASKKLGFDTKQTMQVAQKLYEGITIPKGKIGLITYMRTDSVRVEPKAIDDVRSFIEKKYGTNYLPAKPVEYKDKKAGNIQDAHEAIRPTDLSIEPDSVLAYLSSDEYKLYNLIYSKFVASQMAPAELEKTTIFLDCESNFFRTTGTVLKFDGYKKAFEDSKEEKKKKKGEDSTDEDEMSLPILVKDDKLKPIEKPKMSKEVESPPPRFSESTLVKELEEKGVGRPSTYAAIISNIIAKMYVERDKGRFVPTAVGTSLCRVLVQFFPKEMDIKFTAKVEDSLDDIEDGKVTWLSVVQEFWNELEKSLLKADKEIVRTRPVEPPKNGTGIKCLTCESGEYVVRKGKNGDFLACSNYPSCKSTQNFKKEKSKIIIVEKKIELSAKKCLKCGKQMTLRSSATGNYYACSGYPECKATISEATTNIVCPKCTKGEICARTSQKGTKFWSCSNYKECNQVYWNESDLPKINENEEKK